MLFTKVDHLFTVCVVPSMVYTWQIGGFLIVLITSYFRKFSHSKITTYTVLQNVNVIYGSFQQVQYSS